MLQTNSTVVCTVSQPRWTCPFSRRTNRSGSTMLSRNRLGPALGCVHFSGPSRSGSALRQPSEAQIQLGLRFVPFPGPSSSGVLASAVAASCRLFCLCCSVFWVCRWRPL